MTAPGAMKQPNFAEYRSKLQVIYTQKNALSDQAKAIREQLTEEATHFAAERAEIEKERDELRGRAKEIESKRRNETNARQDKKEEIDSVRRRKQQAEKQLRELRDQVGLFQSVDEIDEAIDHIMIKMETGGGSLAAEKKTVRRLQLLEQSKSLLLSLQPLSEAITDAEDQEADLHREYRAIHERISQLNKDFEGNSNSAQSKLVEARRGRPSDIYERVPRKYCRPANEV